MDRYRVRIRRWWPTTLRASCCGRSGRTRTVPARRFSGGQVHLPLGRPARLRPIGHRDRAVAVRHVELSPSCNARPRLRQLPSADSSAALERGTAYQITDLLYDAVGRVQCSMSADGSGQLEFASPSNCSPTQTTGPNGPDRVSYNNYDAFSRVWKLTTGYGTTAQRPTSKSRPSPATANWTRSRMRRTTARPTSTTATIGW